MTKLCPINIKMKFGSAVVTLPTYENRVETEKYDGVVLFVVKKPDGSWRAMAQIPDGTLETYKHFRLEILKCDWAYED